MASTPTFVATPKLGFGQVSVANTARDGSGTIVDILTAGASGAKVEEIRLAAEADPADSIVTIFIDRTGSSGYEYYDEYDLGNPAAGSTTVSPYDLSTTYANLVLPANAKIGAAITVALTSGVMNVYTHGGDL